MCDAKCNPFFQINRSIDRSIPRWITLFKFNFFFVCLFEIEKIQTKKNDQMDEWWQSVCWKTNIFSQYEEFSIEFFFQIFAFGILKKKRKTTLSKMAMILKQTNRNAWMCVCFLLRKVKNNRRRNDAKNEFKIQFF